MGRSKKQVIKLQEQIVINNETGEVINHQSVKTYKVSTEPNFVKLYLENISMLHDIQMWHANVLYELLELINYDNKIYLSTAHRREIAERLGITTNQISKALVKLVEKRILRKVETGCYIANPMLFGKGSWKDISHIRLTVHWDFEKESIEFETSEIDIK